MSKAKKTESMQTRYLRHLAQVTSRPELAPKPVAKAAKTKATPARRSAAGAAY